jgi:uncharacterized protein YlxW (UPF0749 family)
MGSTILINGNSHCSPYVVKVIGNSEEMAASLGSKTGFAEQLRLFGLGVAIEKAEYLSIPEYKGEITFQYAKPVGNI